MRFLIFLLLISGSVSAQYTYIIQADSTKFRKTGGNNEFILENGTRATTGVLVNYGNGRTRFSKPRINGDTLFVGVDTVLGVGAAGIASASNGLYMSGSDARMGGPMTENTTILTTGFNLSLTGVPFAGAYADSVWTTDGTGAFRRVAQSDVNGGKNRVGLYLNNTETVTNKRAIIFGTQLMFVGNSWAGGTGGTGPAWSTLISDFYGKTKRTSFSNGAELNVAWHASRNLTNGNARDSIWFVDCAYIPYFGMATFINGLFGNDYSDGRSIPKTCNYIREGYRALMANYWMDVDTFSVNSLGDANYRPAVSADSLAGKCAVGAIGLGAFSWAKPAGKTGVFIGTFISDGTRKTQGEVVVRLDGTEIFREDLNSQNIANRRGTAVLGQALAVGYSYKVIALMNLPAAAGTIEVESIGDSTAFDYIGYPVDPTIARKPFYTNNFPYGGGFPYFDIPRTSVDSGNVAIQRAVAEFSSYGYPAFIRNNNQDMDSSTHLFDAHPSTIGNQIIARGYTNNITSVGYVPTVTAATGGSTSPGGADTYVQFNDGGSFGGDAGLVFNKTTNVLTTTAAFNTTVSTGDVLTTGTGKITNNAGLGNIAIESGNGAISVSPGISYFASGGTTTGNISQTGLAIGIQGPGYIAAHSTLQSFGSTASAYNATAVSVGLDINYSVVNVTATGQTITLPTAVGITGRHYTIKLTASGTGTVATTSSQTIDGSTTYSLSAQYKYVTVVSDGANWIITANN